MGFLDELRREYGGYKPEDESSGLIRQAVVDPLVALTQGGGNVIKSAGELVDWTGDKTGIADLRSVGGAIRDYGLKSQEMSADLYSPEAKRAMATPTYDDQTGDINLSPRKIALSSIQSLPDLGVAMIPGGALVKGAEALKVGSTLAKSISALGVGEKRAEAVGSFLSRGLATGGVEGAQAGFANAADTRKQIMDTPDDKLFAVPGNSEILDSLGGDAVKARQQIADQAAGDVLNRTMLTTGGINVLTGGGVTGMLSEKLAAKQLAKAAGLPLAEKRMLGQALEGAGEEFVQEGAQSPVETFWQNLAEQKYMDPNKRLSEGVVNAAIEGALSGGLLGLTGAGSATSHVSALSSERTAPQTRLDILDKITGLMPDGQEREQYLAYGLQQIAAGQPMETATSLFERWVQVPDVSGGAPAAAGQQPPAAAPPPAAAAGMIQDDATNVMPEFTPGVPLTSPQAAVAAEPPKGPLEQAARMAGNPYSTFAANPYAQAPDVQPASFNPADLTAGPNTAGLLSGLVTPVNQPSSLIAQPSGGINGVSQLPQEVQRPAQEMPAVRGKDEGISSLVSQRRTERGASTQPANTGVMPAAQSRIAALEQEKKALLADSGNRGIAGNVYTPQALERVKQINSEIQQQQAVMKGGVPNGQEKGRRKGLLSETGIKGIVADRRQARGGQSVQPANGGIEPAAEPQKVGQVKVEVENNLEPQTSNVEPVSPTPAPAPVALTTEQRVLARRESLRKARKAAGKNTIQDMNEEESDLAAVLTGGRSLDVNDARTELITALNNAVEKGDKDVADMALSQLQNSKFNVSKELMSDFQGKVNEMSALAPAASSLISQPSTSPTPAPAPDTVPAAETKSESPAPAAKLNYIILAREVRSQGLTISKKQADGSFTLSRDGQDVASVTGLQGIRDWLDKPPAAEVEKQEETEKQVEEEVKVETVPTPTPAPDAVPAAETKSESPSPAANVEPRTLNVEQPSTVTLTDDEWLAQNRAAIPADLKIPVVINGVEVQMTATKALELIDLQTDVYERLAAQSSIYEDLKNCLKG